MKHEGASVTLSLADFRPVARFLSDVGRIAKEAEEDSTLSGRDVGLRLDYAVELLARRLMSCRPCEDGRHGACVEVDPDGLTCPCPHDS